MSELFVMCPACDKKERHSVITAKGEKVVAKCSKCGALHYAKTNSDKADIMLITSKGGRASKTFMRFEPSERISVGQLIARGKTKYEVCAIDDKGGGHVKESKATAVRNVYLKPYTKKLPVSVHKVDGTTVSYKIVKAKDEIVKLGDHMKLGKSDVELIRISTLDGDVESAKAGDVLAVTGKPSEIN